MFTIAIAKGNLVTRGREQRNDSSACPYVSHSRVRGTRCGAEAVDEDGGRRSGVTLRGAGDGDGGLCTATLSRAVTVTDCWLLGEASPQSDCDGSRKTPANSVTPSLRSASACSTSNPPTRQRVSVGECQVRKCHLRLKLTSSPQLPAIGKSAVSPIPSPR